MAILRAVRARFPGSILVAGLALASTGRAAGPVGPERASVATGGAQATGGSYECAVSAKGTFVAFGSEATDLVAGTVFGGVFVRDLKTGETTLASVATDGTGGDGGGRVVGLSANGRTVAFGSFSTNLVPGDTNGFNDIFVHDRKTGGTRRVSVASDGTQGDAGSFLYNGCLSANGRFVAFHSSATNLVPGDVNGQEDVFVHDLKTGTTTLVGGDDGSLPDGRSFAATMSASGRFVAFSSSASNLVPGDANGRDDAFVHDLRTGATRRASVDSQGNQANGFVNPDPCVSANGQVVAFYSDATNLVANDSNGADDVFVHDFRTGETRRVSVASDGTEATGGGSYSPAISSNGRTVVFYSNATNLAAGDGNARSDVFLHDLRTGTTRRVSVDAQGQEGNARSFSGAASLSSNGKFLAFWSDAGNLVAGDTNGQSDVFVVGAR